MRTAGSGQDRRLRKALVASSLLAALLAPAAATAAGSEADRPRVISLPNGWQPEGIDTIDGGFFFSGSVATGAVWRGNLRTGKGSILVPPHDGRVAVGLKVRNGLIWVAGGPTGRGFVYDARTGEDVDAFRLSRAEGVFINDVVVTSGAAWFTDSSSLNLFKVPIEGDRTFGKPQTLPLTGDIEFVEGMFSNANGIDAVPGARLLVIVQTSTGRLFTVDRRTGHTSAINLGGKKVPGGDGILLDGDRLWVVHSGKLALVRVDKNLERGEVILRRRHRTFDVPTTVAESGGNLAIVNARFGNENPSEAKYWVTQIPKPTS